VVWQVFWLVPAALAFPRACGGAQWLAGWLPFAKLTAAGLSMNFTLFPLGAQRTECHVDVA